MLNDGEASFWDWAVLIETPALCADVRINVPIVILLLVDLI
jgi:hypothetical protein